MNEVPAHKWESKWESLEEVMEHYSEEYVLYLVNFAEHKREQQLINSKKYYQRNKKQTETLNKALRAMAEKAGMSLSEFLESDEFANMRR